MMCIKMINTNDGILKTILNPRDHFNITLMVDGLNQSSSFIYGHMNEAFKSRLWVLSTFKRQLFFPH